MIVEVFSVKWRSFSLDFWERLFSIKLTMPESMTMATMMSGDTH